ncbi:MAG: bifunctional 4-hydroxy-2-oxoglutarate aldolase/2-dehydro-3-deoxy-phosphogluconate aldolase [Chloroflexota bacterium]
MSMRSQQVYERIAASHVVAGIRGHFPPEIALQITGILMDHAISIFEFTMNSTEPLAAMQAVKQRYGNDVVVGMGTVLDVDVARQALDAGADFVVSPAFQPDVVKYVHDAGVMMAPGVITPSEAVAAWSMGVPMLKLFPIGSLGVDYFKAIFGPLNHMRFMCNGGINPENTRDLLKAGAVAVGMAGWLTGDGRMSAETMHQRARQLMSAVSAATGEPRVV